MTENQKIGISHVSLCRKEIICPKFRLFKQNFEFWPNVCRTVGQDCQECKETSSPLADKQQKMGEHVENIKCRGHHAARLPNDGSIWLVVDRF